jgi:hypothetical protein
MESRGALLTVAIPLLAFKVWFAILLLMYAPTRDTAVWIAATHWPFVILLVLLVPAFVASYRLLRARARRAQLRRAEFMLSPVKPRNSKVRRLVRPGRTVQCSALWETVSRLEGDDSSGRVAR